MHTITADAYSGDIAARLKNWRGLHLAHSGELFEEAAAEIERLREAIRRLAEQDATLSVCNGNVTVTMDATLTDAEREAAILDLQREVEMLRLTEKERNAIESAAKLRLAVGPDCQATLRGLLERMGGER